MFSSHTLPWMVTCPALYPPGYLALASATVQEVEDVAVAWCQPSSNSLESTPELCRAAHWSGKATPEARPTRSFEHNLELKPAPPQGLDDR